MGRLPLFHIFSIRHHWLLGRGFRGGEFSSYHLPAGKEEIWPNVEVLVKKARELANAPLVLIGVHQGDPELEAREELWGSPIQRTVRTCWCMFQLPCLLVNIEDAQEVDDLRMALCGRSVSPID